ncbi:MAG: peroxiredoxin family protein, partial [Pirellulaceae bacterium]
SMLDWVRSINPVHTEDKILSLVAILQDNHPNIAHSTLAMLPNSLSGIRVGSQVSRPAAAGYPIPITLNALAEAVAYELEHLQPGDLVPEIAGSDGHGNPFNISSLRGKSVVLFFAANWNQADAARYETCRQLKSSFGGQPFEIVSVMRDADIGTVKRALDSGQITWQTVWDGTDNIATQWNVTNAPSDILLIDPSGVIQKRLYSNQELVSHIDALFPTLKD